MSRQALRHRTSMLLSVLVVALTAATTLAVAPTHAAEETPKLHLVTLTGPGTSATSGDAATSARAMLARQDAVLAGIEAAEPVYRWTTALNGFAVELTPDQVRALGTHDDVAAIEANTVLPLAARASAPVPGALPAAARGSGRGGAGVVIGIIDSGIDPSSPLFADVPKLGAAPAGYVGECTPGDGWTVGTCNRKIVGAGWWVAGFGQDRIRTSETLSAHDAMGHGTQVASVAAGNREVSVRMDGRTVGSFSGVAPRARIAPYKACWAAPDPTSDGCATADLVSAIDRATADGVDVLNLSVAGPNSVDTVQRALLGAAESDIVVVAAAGNDGQSSFAAHATPWVTTVGAVRGSTLRGQVRIAGGPRLDGASRSRRALGPLRLVSGAQAKAPGARARDARQCRPGSLDARRVAGRAVLCHRGGIGRVDKSLAVARADGAAMVLVNDRPGGVVDDFHSVPTIHLAQPEGRRLMRWVRRHDRTAVRLAPLPARTETARAASWTAPGDGRSTLLKPDLVAEGQGVLGAVPDSWSLFSGTSAAAARVSGVAALVRAEHDWPESVVRSVLTTTSTPVRGASTLVQGAGRVSTDPSVSGLALGIPRAGYRQALESATWSGLNMSSVVLRAGGTTTRRVTNLGRRATYFSVAPVGFERHEVRVTPAALRLAPGESARVRISVSQQDAPQRLDDGWIVWRGARGTENRLPVAITR